LTLASPTPRQRAQAPLHARDTAGAAQAVQEQAVSASDGALMATRARRGVRSFALAFRARHELPATVTRQRDLPRVPFARTDQRELLVVAAFGGTLATERHASALSAAPFASRSWRSARRRPREAPCRFEPPAERAGAFGGANDLVVVEARLIGIGDHRVAMVIGNR